MHAFHQLELCYNSQACAWIFFCAWVGSIVLGQDKIIIQHPPLILSCDADWVPQSDKVFLLEWLSEYVRNLVLRLHVFHLHILSCNALSYVMIAGIYVFASVMEYQILSFELSLDDVDADEVPWMVDVGEAGGVVDSCWISLACSIIPCSLSSSNWGKKLRSLAWEPKFHSPSSSNVTSRLITVFPIVRIIWLIAFWTWIISDEDELLTVVVEFGYPLVWYMYMGYASKNS